MSTKEFEKVLITREEIKDAVEKLGKRISKDYEGKELLLVCILKGAFVFCSDLVRNITIPVTLDFLSASSYGQTSVSSGNVQIYKDLETDIIGKHVLLVEDIIDTGLTLKVLKGIMTVRNPASVKICTLLDKKDRRKVDITPEYCCFSIPDEFVVGYGLDYSEKYRNLPDIMVLSRSVYE